MAVAISFTLCSMQSALQPVPNECGYRASDIVASVTNNKRSWWTLSEGDERRSRCLRYVSVLHETDKQRSSS